MFPVLDQQGTVTAFGGIEVDITDRKRAEEELAEKEAQLRIALENMPGGIKLIDGDLKYVLVNSQYSELCSFPAGLVEVGGSMLDELRFQAERGDFGSDGVDEALEEVLAFYRKNEAARWERTLVNGRTVEVRVAPMPEGGHVNILTDISERKRAEEALAAKEAQLRVALDNMPGGMLMFDKDHRVIVLNDQYRQLFEFPEDLVVEGGSAERSVRFQAERGDFGAGDVDELVGKVMATLMSREPAQYERRLSSGRAVEVSVAPTPEGGNVAVYNDITERKRAEDEVEKSREQLQALADNLPEFITMKDSDGRFIFVNKQFEEWVCQSRDDVIGKTVHDIYPKKQATEFAALDRKAIEDRRILSQEVDLSFPDGKTRAIIRTRFPVISSQGEVLGLGNVNRDITERKQAEDELQAAYGIIKDQKERMEEELNVGHEIQMSMIPLKFPPFPDHDEFSIYAALEPAREVGGDFYDYYFLDEERFCFCIGDVSGKGVPAALFMAMTKTLIKSRAADDGSTASIITHVNDELSRNNKNCMFVTIFAGILNVRTGEMLYTNAGHNPPFIRRKGGTLQRLDKRDGPAVGAMEGMVYTEERDMLEPDDLLFLYTDGVTEAMDIGHHLFSEDRLKDLLASLETDDADTAVDDTVSAVRAFEGEAEQADDITVLGLKYQGKSEDALMVEQRITIKNRMSEIAAVNEKFEAFAEEFGIPATTAMKFNVIFDELLNNIVTYAYTDDGGHDIEVRMGLAGKRLTVTVIDDGVPFNPLSEEAPNIAAPLEEREIGGLGIHLVRNLIDDVSYQRRIGKNVMTLTCHLE
jgi:sigma-B regulation protein RsbU (phosphoserine phosphatase)